MPGSPTTSSVLIQYSGHILRKPEVRNRPLDAEGHMVPVLCIELETDSPLRLPIHVEQPFPADQHAACEAAARRLRKGMLVTVQAPIVGHRLIINNAAHVRAEPEEPQWPPPCA